VTIGSDEDQPSATAADMLDATGDYDDLVRQATIDGRTQVSHEA
jgi:hypothetical protein